jgi:hypothetical protein
MFNFFNETSYTFEGKKGDENVVLFLHRHWFTLSGRFTLLTVLALLPILILLIFGQTILEYKLIPMFTLLWSAYVMVLWISLFYTLTMYTLDYWVITNERIVDNIQLGLFNRKISELSIHMIQDVSVKLVGILPTFFNYGTLLVQTAAQEGNFVFEEVPNPQKVKDVLMGIIEKTEDALGPHIRGVDRTHYFNLRANRPSTNQQNIDDASNTLADAQITPAGYNIDKSDKSSISPKGNIPPNLPL